MPDFPILGWSYAGRLWQMRSKWPVRGSESGFSDPGRPAHGWCGLFSTPLVCGPMPLKLERVVHPVLHARLFYGGRTLFYRRNRVEFGFAHTGFSLGLSDMLKGIT